MYLLTSDFMCNMAAWECQVNQTQPTAEVIQRSASFTRLTTLGEASADSSYCERWICWNVQPVPVNVKLEGRSEPRRQGHHASDQATGVRDLDLDQNLELMEKVYNSIHQSLIGRQKVGCQLETRHPNPRKTLNFRRCRVSIPCTAEIQKSGDSPCCASQGQEKTSNEVCNQQRGAGQSQSVYRICDLAHKFAPISKAGALCPGRSSGFSLWK
ncbi:hypothetical protein N7481_012303 [Penicillium waksmanii]|uniref:uncharacterized protein n=1 Tax=Penicillium waksmanii TaxID=69791 RepID=UPI002546C99A|nr:uncharacterized protein N7481_012303 [Penicillium waksmanii]KAJ5965589.1 hypothetical protein N7481_012303 [Penicillium waksmanii]